MMYPQPPPPPPPSLLTKAIASRKKLAVGAIAVIVIAWVLRPTPVSSPPPLSTVPHRTANPSLANDTTDGTHVAQPQLPDDQTEQVARYPMLDSPDEIAPDEEIHIQVSLTEEQEGPELKSISGQTTPDGQLVFSLPATPENSWKIDVVLMASDLEFTHGTTTESSIVLPRQGDATIAIFYARLKAKALQHHVAHVMAVFYYNGNNLAHISRDINIVSALPANAPTEPVMRRTTQPAAATFNYATINQAVTPDLTLTIEGGSMVVSSPYIGRAKGDMPDMKGFAEWLARESPRHKWRGGQVVDDAENRQADHETAEGFGEDLYEHYAPDVFKQAFWMLVDLKGKDFRTIQIYSDDPSIPWELMRPVRGKNRMGFLGLNYSVAHWYLSNVLRQHPPNTEKMQGMFGIAPQYTSTRALAAQTKEMEALARMEGYHSVHGNMNALRLLFREPPQGIVHFAGHGELDASGRDYEILLEDGALGTTRWKSWAPDDPASHTFYFFNACDVGQTKQSGNFVDGWGPTVLAKGASGYIGAVFPVDDEVAQEFAAHFYELLDQEMQTGPADVSATLERTRRDIYARTKDPTALAYVLYGDTNLAFIR